MAELLAIDMGNTHIKIGVANGATWEHEWRLSTDVHRTVDEYRLSLKGLFAEAEVDRVERTVIASVVPHLTPLLLHVARSVSRSEPVEVTPRGYGLHVDYPPESLGADRFINALAAWRMFQGNVIVVDVGTTATVDAVADGTYLGGAIAPGPHFLAQALHQGTARLPHVIPEIRPWRIGKTTQEAILTGVGQGFVGMVNALIEGTRQIVGVDAHVVVTGGWAARLYPYLTASAHMEPRLTLEGLRYADMWLRQHERVLIEGGGMSHE